MARNYFCGILVSVVVVFNFGFMITGSFAFDVVESSNLREGGYKIV